jgi:RNA polymerase sigma-70 factor (ECF subfamily)
MEAPHLPTATNLGGYLFVMASNKVLNQLSQQQTRHQHLRSLARFADEQPRTPLEQLSEKELSAFIEQEIQQLPAKMKAVFELSRKHQFTHREIADAFQLSDKTVKKQIHNALKIIRLRLHARMHGLH